MKSTLFGQEFAETQTDSPFVLQNERMLKVKLTGGEIRARQGSMVAYQGDANFAYEGAGAKKLLKKMFTGEDLQLMTVSGTGEVFFAHNASEIHLVYLENDALTVNGSNVLAFETGLEWDIVRVKGVGMFAGGLFNVQLKGTGWVALTSHGTPVLLDAGEARTFADIGAAIAWSSSLQTSIHKSDSIMKSMIGRGSGELAQMEFTGTGFAIVQPAESTLEQLIMSMIPPSN
jgi:uncharacterized protein (AIM24 family)